MIKYKIFLFKVNLEIILLCLELLMLMINKSNEIKVISYL